ncbi:type I polyketide synthase [Streptomyces indicus]|uniref:Acyl transferase domain-containing protein n=1 Tax=Streptomyces indicus TaxID=417292 RepID=A0A1G8YQT8_9ACTN|nr:type I polyketide synthase [Streptomyces indicus]SDK05209.1 Acyl transferase domain-containing protein [Streptomyces indicus]
MTQTVIGVSPFGEPNARLAAAVSRAGGLGVLDLGSGGRQAREALTLARRWTPGAFGVRVGKDCAFEPEELRDAAGPHTVLLAPDAPWSVAQVPAHTVLVEVRSAAEAVHAVEDGASGLVVRGSECGGPCGELSTFVLLQRVLAVVGESVPVWACGGIGPHTAAAAVLAGATGVVLDVQLALLEEGDVAPAVGAFLRTADGSETVIVGGSRVLDRRRPGLPPVLREDLLPLGQDAFLGTRFAAKYGTVRAALAALHRGIDEAVRADGAALRGGSAMCRALGTALPVAQGPMTRVSDQARFAAAVADGGGLPFIALALAGREQTRSMLEQTRAALGDRSWGVGILGFAPEEVRTAQLEAVREIRPSHVVIAGGRPSQAAALEADGIVTFLHVPSPGLLGQFLAAGARRFVFEGAECGGHIGPRNSFPLWEAQLAVLEDFLDEHDDVDPAAIQVFFAGGIHDERSAAMVAALAAPLTARGLATGVLMGTAYLFTEEAVACGAIRPLFQQAVLDAEATELLHTAPGHATRCVPSAFTAAYQSFKDELREQGVPDRQAWEELERLNVGRLRIASKGIERVGDELVDVDEQRQVDEGMFMAGEVAVLRAATTTVAELHHGVADRAAEFYARRAARLRTDEAQEEAPEAAATVPDPLDIAVVGMSAMFPGAPDLDAFWAQILAGEDAVTEVPAERWDPALHFGEDAEAHDVSASKWGGFLPRIPFDALAYGIPPASLASIEPVQLLALEAARRALKDAGLDRKDFPRERTCVVFGAEAGSDTSNATTLRTVLPSYLGRLPEGIEQQLPKLTEDSFPGLLSNVISGRIANRLDLGGANFTVDAACASSLTAVDVACAQLASGAADVALCGGADLHNGINDFLLFSSVHALSKTGRCKPFAADADGIALGEGVACVVLKRRADAERDGDRIYAVIKGVGAASDGRSLGLTAPRPEGQRAALERAYAQARISPAEVGLVEAHGTGTVVGDRTELTVLSEVFTEAGAERGGCVVGSVKSQIGHTKCAAGLAGLIKTALALHTGVRPPTLHISEPNPAWSEAHSPFAFHGRALPWAEPPARRTAGVSAFGFGGTNFHVVLQAYDGGVPPRQGSAQWPAELFVFRSREAVEETLALAESGAWRLRDLAYAAARRAETAPRAFFGAVVAESTDELPSLLRDLLDSKRAAGVFPADTEGLDGKVAFLFPGQGSQRPGMLAEVFAAFPETQRHLHGAPVDALFPPAAFGDAERKAQRARLTDTRNAQPALGAVSLAAYDVLTLAGVRPDMAGGHSYGELVALCAAGSIDPAALAGLSRARADAILAATGEDPGAMAAVVASAEETGRVIVEAGLHDRVVAANHNAPAQTVISGPTEAVAQAVEALGRAGFTARTLPVACAFHSPLVARAVPRFSAALAGYPVRTPEFPVWANRTGTRYPSSPADVRVNLAEQIGAPVRFAEQIEAMYEAGARVFVEAGPGTVLSGLVGQILGDRPHAAVPFEPRPDCGLRGHLDALARLFAAGVDLAATRLFAGRDAALATRGAEPKRPAWTVDGHLVRTADGSPLPGALQPARRIALEASVSTDWTGHSPDDPEALLRAFLQNSREMVAAQRDVLLTYFGGAGAVAPAPVAVPVAGPELPVTPVMPVLPVLEASVVETGATPQPAAEAPAAATPAVDVLGTVLAVIAERTGYPVEMIEPDLDLEADLSVDSIKRTEIAGELGRRLLGSGTDLRSLPDAELEELTRARTAAGIAEWLEGRAGAAPAAASAPAVAAAPAAAPAPASAPEAAVDVLGTVLAVIAERTGYPVEMIEPDLDLEADLSVDSIKRTEIAGELGRRLLGSGTDLRSLPDAELEELTRARTAAGIAEWLTVRVGGAQEPAAAAPAQASEDLLTGNPAEDPAWIDHTPDAADLRTLPGSLAPEPAAGPAPMEPTATQWDAPAPVLPADTEPVAVQPQDGRLVQPQDTAALVQAQDFTPVRPQVQQPAEAAEPIEPVQLQEPVQQPESQPEPAADPEPEPALTIAAPKRYLLAPTPLDPAPAPGAVAANDLRGKRFLLVGDGTPVAQALVTRLTVLGAIASRAGEDLEGHQGAVDGLIHVGALAEGAEPVLPGAFPLFRAALRRSPRWLLAAQHAKDTSGLAGFFRTVAREYPDTVARSVEVDPTRGAAEQAEMIVEELLAPDREPVVLRTRSERRGLAVREQDLGLLATAGAGPAGTGVAEATVLGLGPDSVVVLAGGARGITARFAVALAAASRCRIELLGRTELPDVPDEFPDARDRAALRAALIARGGLRPAEIERTVSRVLAQREIASTLAEIHDAGGTAGYRPVDLRDAEAVQQAVKETYAMYGRIDGVVHAAGVIEDKLIAEKDPDSFGRVYGTKVDGARTLLAALHRLPQLPRFTVLFGSISAVFGNRGQIDYAAANDALARIGRRWQEATGTRALTVHWGPWAPTGAHDGMVGPELGREYARRGIELIDPEEGVLALLRELAWGDAETDEVVYTASGW